MNDPAKSGPVEGDSAEVAKPDHSPLDSGTYEVLRGRLRSAAEDLQTRIAKLNESRQSVFGSIPTKLQSTARVTTEHNSTPRDLLAIDDRFVLGYNVQFGLKSDIAVTDVFSAYRLDGDGFSETEHAMLSDPAFVEDFKQLYRFYKDTRFSRFYVDDPMVHMVFQVGKTARDIKTFKWRIVDGHAEYLGNRSEHEIVEPPQHEFRWKRTTRDQHHYGAHPHVSIEDIVFVETVGGDLTIKVENNTDSGEGIYAEPVDHADQTLDDAEVSYAILGNLVLLRMKPYQEDDARYLVFNRKLSTVMRLDEIGHTCIQLPSDHGIIFPGGYYLQTGRHKRFDHGLESMRFIRSIPAAGGEDYLYLFFNVESGTYIQLRYNVITQTVDTPLVCHGQSIFDDGRMLLFKSQAEPTRHHAIQVWQTPFVSEIQAPAGNEDSLLFKIGNKDIVRAMADIAELSSLIEKDDNYDGLYIDLSQKAAAILDTYFWIDKEEAFEVSRPLVAIRDAATTAIEEFDRVVRIRRDTAKQTSQVEASTRDLVTKVQRERNDSITSFVDALSELRTLRGKAIGLTKLRYVEESRVESIQELLTEWTDRVSHRLTEFMMGEQALKPYWDRHHELSERVSEVKTVVEADDLRESISKITGQLDLLIETVSNLKIDDATQRTAIIDSISAVYTGINQTIAKLKNQRRSLLDTEGRAEFGSQLQLLQQTVARHLESAETPEAIEEALAKVMVQVEELEGRFAEFDDFVLKLAERREEIYAALETRKVELLQRRNQRAETMAAAAGRILSGIQSRLESMDSAESMASYLAGDLMVAKVRDIAGDLREMGDAVRAEDILSRLGQLSDTANRSLQDRQDLYEADGKIIRMGRHRFAVNTASLDLTTVVRDDKLCLHVTGTQFFSPLEDEALAESKDLWDQPLVSESADVYRAEYLAYDALRASEPPSIDGRFEEGYTKGVHDQDAIKIHEKLVEVESGLGLLKYPASVRSDAIWIWVFVFDPQTVARFDDWFQKLAHLKKRHPGQENLKPIRVALSKAIEESSGDRQPPYRSNLEDVVDYLVDQRMATTDGFVTTAEVIKAIESWKRSIPTSERPKLSITKSVSPEQAKNALSIARGWAKTFLDSKEQIIDAAMILASPRSVTLQSHSADQQIEVAELLGDHPSFQDGVLSDQYHHFIGRMNRHRREFVPRFRAMQQAKHVAIEKAREDIRLDEYRPKVLSSFVRNRLIDEVYLPIVGDNLAKQIGTADDSKRSDRMGLLLLISPPGYGKTTLMEYIAQRLGIVMVKINGPALGHDVKSLDPDEAPNAAAREEVERLNMALEMGDNVMIYVDDIQHTHPEFLQKFISLCDATRKIEGVNQGRTKTYDFRGRRVAVVMAGNPYNESGSRFQIPDMLANRADVYNLGEIIGSSAEAFEMSYLENAVTSNATLAPLATGGSDDVRKLIEASRKDEPGPIELGTPRSADQISEMVEVLRKMRTARDVVLKVNRSYIDSAAQADEYRDEPAFKLQGSYRNMNRIVEKLSPVMNDEEVREVIETQYIQDAQTLTSDNEANLLKFKELTGWMTEEERQRWEQIKYKFGENQRLMGLDSDDQISMVMAQLGSMRDGLQLIRTAIETAAAASLAESNKAQQTPAEPPRIDLPKVVVQHKIPRVLVDLVKGQFHLMQEWMRPILEESMSSGRDLQLLKEQFEKTMQEYRDVNATFDGEIEAEETN
ncbi:MAG: DNA repair ATPase [Planctomycetota bacterium]